MLATPLGLHLATLVSNSMLPVRTRPARWATLGMAVLVAGGAVIFLTQRQPFAPPAAITPQAAVQAVQAAGIRGEVFNDYDYGGYLIFRVIRPFVDGRTDLYGDAFLRTLNDAPLHGKLRELLDAYSVTWTLLPVQSLEVALLDGWPQWRRLYADAHVVVHLRHHQEGGLSGHASALDGLEAGPSVQTGRARP